VDRSLIVTYRGKEIFSSRAKWLFPLFDLEEFLTGKDYPVNEMDLTEKVAGQAAAFLIARLGFLKCHVKLISEHAIAVFNRFGITYTFEEKVSQIQCRTEHILMKEMSLEGAWQLLRRRAGRVHGADVSIQKLEVNIRGRCIINCLDLDIKRGDGMIICGENGVGKTTLLRSMLGLQSINSGIVKIADVQVGSPVWKKNRHITGYVNQERPRGFFPVSAAEVVEIGAKIMICIAVFQLFDVLGHSYYHALRGAGDTTWPMIMLVISHWAVVIGGGSAIVRMKRRSSGSYVPRNTIFPQKSP